MPFIGLQPFLQLTSLTDSEIRFSVNALHRASAISTADKYNVSIDDAVSVNALHRASAISTL